MSKELSASQKLLRLYQRLFSEDKQHYQSSLAKELNCSPQTIMRLADEIERECPDCFKRGLEKGRRWYRLQANHKNKLGLDYQELHYLSLCRELSKNFIPEEIVQRIDKIIFQLSTVLLELDTKKYSDYSEVLTFFSKGKIDYSDFTTILEDLLTCIEGNFFFHLHYIANDSIKGKRYYFVPNKLIAMNNALYVYGAITNNVGNKLINTICLAVHRIQKLDLIKQTSDIKIPTPNNKTFGLPWHEPKVFTIHFTKDVANYVKERMWSEKQQIEELDNGEIVLTITTTSEPELIAWVQSFGGKAELVMP